MECLKTSLISFVFNNNNRQFIIPVYQRNYDWKTDNCQTLFNDVVDAYLKHRNHFMGTFVQCDSTYIDSVSTHIIIDGQQRLTTIYLFLKALEVLCEGDEYTKNQLNALMFNNLNAIPLESQAKFKLKLKAVTSDQSQLEFLLDNKFDDLDKKSNIYINYNFFKRTISKAMHDKNLEVSNFLEGLRNLEFVMITLHEPEDDPQVVFERINSTGEDLKLSDLMRNYLLMTETNMEVLYKDYWLPMEEKVGKEKLDDYLTTYLTFKLTDTNDNNSYDAFKKYVSDNSLSHIDILSELKKYSKYYALFVGVEKNPERYYSGKVIDAIRNFDYLKNTTIYPLLFFVFDDYDNGFFNDDVLIEFLQFFFNYLVRRLIVGIPSNTLRKFFKGLYKRAIPSDIKPSGDEYLHAFYDVLISLPTKDGIITDEKFIEALKNDDLYSSIKISFCKFLLASIENSSESNNERVAIDGNITIEHIMPQTLNSWWSNEIKNNPEVHETHLHRLGNLSLTGINSQLSNESFDEKKKEYAKTRFTYLYCDVLDKERWDKTSIDIRGERLAKRLAEILPLPDYVKERVLYRETVKSPDSVHEYYLDEGHDFTSKKVVSYTFNGEHPATYMRDVLFGVCSELYSMYPDGLKDVASKNGMTYSEAQKYYFISFNPDELIQPREIGQSGIYVGSTKNSSREIACVQRLFDYFDISYDEFSIRVLD